MFSCTFSPSSNLYVRTETRKKMKRSLSSSESSTAETREPFPLGRLPPEVLQMTLLPLETTFLLSIVSINTQVREVLEDDYFWRRKLLHDFPDLVEFAGTSLPEWVIVTEQDSSFGMGPWRRYYYTARYFMRRVYRALIDLAQTVAPLVIADPLVDLPLCPFYIQGAKMVKGATRAVTLFEYKRNVATGARQGRSGIRRVMDINAFCAKYLLYSPDLSGSYSDVMNQADPFHYGRRPETVNSIRVLMTQVAYFENLTDRAIFNGALEHHFRQHKLRKFMGWILHLHPVFNPYEGFRGLDTHEYIAKGDVGDNVWVRNVSAPAQPALDPGHTVSEVTMFTRSRIMQNLWKSMSFSDEGVGELRMTAYEKDYLIYRASYLGLPRDQQGRILIGEENKGGKI